MEITVVSVMPSAKPVAQVSTMYVVKSTRTKIHEPVTYPTVNVMAEPQSASTVLLVLSVPTQRSARQQQPKRTHTHEKVKKKKKKKKKNSTYPLCRSNPIPIPNLLKDTTSNGNSTLVPTTVISMELHRGSSRSDGDNRNVILVGTHPHSVSGFAAFRLCVSLQHFAVALHVEQNRVGVLGTILECPLGATTFLEGKRRKFKVVNEVADVVLY